MKIAFYDTHRFEQALFEKVFATSSHTLSFFDTRLGLQSVGLAKDHDAVCCFVNDCLNAEILNSLNNHGINLIALRSAGYNHVDTQCAKNLAMSIVRVPAYSPYAVAEHALALLMCVNRKIHKAYARVKDFNFSLEGLVGFDLHGKTVGILGTGRIGLAAIKIFKGLGCEVLAYDKIQNNEAANKYDFNYTDLPTLFKKSNVISLHLPLINETRHILNKEAFEMMKEGVVILNTGRGALIESTALVDALKSKKLGGAGLDVYELEEGIFFNDLSDCGLDDDLLARLISFPNVVVTSHQAFLTHEALHNIAEQTLKNIDAFANGSIINQV
jgi:D-lactate dehydrogenase